MGKKYGNPSVRENWVFRPLLHVCQCDQYHLIIFGDSLQHASLILKQGIRCLVSRDHIARSSLALIEVSFFFAVDR